MRVCHRIRRRLLGYLLRSEKRKIAVLVDHLNIVLENGSSSKSGKRILDYNRLREQCAEHGQIIFAYTFYPEDYEMASNVYNNGFWPIPCLPKNISIGNYKDRVDNALTEMGLGLLDHSDIDALVLVVNDGDFARLASKFKGYGKKVHLIHGEKVSGLFQDIVDTRDFVPLR